MSVQRGPLHDCVLLFVQLETEPGAWVDREIPPVQKAGALFVQGADEPLPSFQGSFDCLVFSLPRAALRRFTSQLGMPRIDRFRCTFEQPVVDPIIRALGTSLVQSLESHSQFHAAFVEHVLSAVSVHIVESYGQEAEVSAKGSLEQGDLARAQALLRDFRNRISIEQVAKECGLSASYFSRAFQRSTGFGPHRWQMNARVEAAKEMLRDSGVRLADIAAACGFADQSHFSRVFRSSTGASPQSFRRAFRPAKLR